MAGLVIRSSMGMKERRIICRIVEAIAVVVVVPFGLAVASVVVAAMLHAVLGVEAYGAFAPASECKSQCYARSHTSRVDRSSVAEAVCPAVSIGEEYGRTGSN